MSRRTICICGVHVVALPFLEKLLASGIVFDCMVTIDEQTAQHNKVSGWYDYREFAKKNNIPLYYARRYDLKDARDLDFFASNRFDVIVQGGWQRLFPQKVLETLGIGAIGVHGSPDFLPLGRGRSPLNWSLIENRARFLVHLFLMKPDVDDGDVIFIDEFDINPFDDIDTLYMKLAILNARMHIKFINDLETKNIQLVPQIGEPTYFPKRSEADGEINWSEMDYFEIYNFVRAQTRPYPGAFGLVEDRWVRIWKCQPFDTRIKYPGHTIGEVVERFSRGFVVNCRGGLLLVTDWELLGSKPG